MLLSEKTSTETSLLKKVKKAWELAPPGTKARVCKSFKCSRQNIYNILDDGRKDEKILTELLDTIKEESKNITLEFIKAYKQVKNL
tara:strand:- start:540 stop:797 length:258 start_codon:yes stop_codon:yes gene_type:complete